MEVDNTLNQEEKRASRKKEKPLTKLQRLVQQSIAENVPLGNDEDQAQVDWPTLWEWLSNIDAGKEHVMEPGRLTIALQPGGVSVQLNHRGLAYVCECHCPCLADCFSALEAALSGPNPPLREMGRGRQKIRKRQKK